MPNVSWQTASFILQQTIHRGILHHTVAVVICNMTSANKQLAFTENETQDKALSRHRCILCMERYVWKHSILLCKIFYGVTDSKTCWSRGPINYGKLFLEGSVLREIIAAVFPRLGTSMLQFLHVNIWCLSLQIIDGLFEKATYV